MKIIILGAHPDDPESGCGGLAARCVEAGHEVVFTYGTAFRPGREFFGRPEREVRTEEALAACHVFGVRGIVWDYPHGEIHVNPENVARVTAYLVEERPDVVIAHWPVDTHYDHRCIGTLALSAYMSPETDFEFYYFEVMTGRQSMHFHPTHYVDISDVAEIKHQALLCHKSQKAKLYGRITRSCIVSGAGNVASSALRPISASTGGIQRSKIFRVLFRNGLLGSIKEPKEERPEASYVMRDTSKAVRRRMAHDA